MTSLQQALPPPGQPLWQGASSTRKRECRVKHITIKGTQTRYEPSPHTIYKINVQTEDNHWVVFRRYKQFYSLHQKLVKEYGIARDLLPPKKFGKSTDSDVVSKRKTQLEQYLQKIINSDPEVSGCPELFSFLEVLAYSVVETTSALAHHLYTHGDSILGSSDPFTLTPNQMYCISERLKLPLELGLEDDISHDPAHLYEFVHEVHRLLVAPPPCHTSQSCTSFDFAPFKSLQELHIHHVPFNQVQSLTSVHQQLQSLSITESNVDNVRGVLVDKAAEIRPGASIPPESLGQADNWRIVATAKLQTKRIVIHPWHNLKVLNLSYNQLTSLHTSLLLLHSLTDLDISHNAITKLELQFLTLPELRTLVASHNSIQEIVPKKKVLESLVVLDLSHNELRQLTGLPSFVNVANLDLSQNALRDPHCLKQMKSLTELKTLELKGNPLVSRPSYRLLAVSFFHLAKREVAIDNRLPTGKDLEQVSGSVDKFGPDVFTWPIAKKLLQLMEHTEDLQLPDDPQEYVLSPPSPSDDLAYAIVSSNKPPKKPVAVLRTDSHDSLVQFNEDSDSLSPPFPTNADVYDTDSLSEGPVFISPAHDGSQDTTPTMPSNQVTPPPSTPLGVSLTNQDSFMSNPKQNGVINPQTILSALYALSRNLSDSSEQRTPSRPSSPRQSFTSDEVATAIKSLISSQTTTPPSTPLAERKVDNQSISASDLVLALRHLVAHNSGTSTLSEEGVDYIVPQSTPYEDEGKREISIEDLMGALSTLSIGVSLDSTGSGEKEEDHEDTNDNTQTVEDSN